MLLTTVSSRLMSLLRPAKREKLTAEGEEGGKSSKGDTMHNTEGALCWAAPGPGGWPVDFSPQAGAVLHGERFGPQQGSQVLCSKRPQNPPSPAPGPPAIAACSPAPAFIPARQVSGDWGPGGESERAGTLRAGCRAVWGPRPAFSPLSPAAAVAMSSHMGHRQASSPSWPPRVPSPRSAVSGLGRAVR